jgi:hypothetical protein
LECGGLPPLFSLWKTDDGLYRLDSADWASMRPQRIAADRFGVRRLAAAVLAVLNTGAADRYGNPRIAVVCST